MPRRIADLVTTVILGALGAGFLAVALLSLKWRMVHDSPIMLYLGFLIDRFHAVPYRDFFDMNMPGTHIFNFLLGRIFGYNDLGFRLADLLCLGGILTATWFWLRDLGARVAWSTIILFGLFYLGHGPIMSLQREFILLLPLSAALPLLSSFPRLREPLRLALLGICFGAAASIKPQAALGLPVLLAYRTLVLSRGTAGATISHRLSRTALAAAVAGFCLPLLALAVWLACTRALLPFLDIAGHYWPLYGRLDKWHRTIADGSRPAYLWVSYLTFGGRRKLMAAGAVGVFLALGGSTLDARGRGKVLLLAGLALLYSLYPVIAGQFWGYHWLPFLYFLLPLCSLCLLRSRPGAGLGWTLLPPLILLLALFLTLRPPAEFVRQVTGKELEPPKGGRVDQMAAYLKNHLRPGDTVQPLDWTGGAVHAMLLARARAATPFIYDFHFYHHVSSPYIHRLRKRFLKSLRSAKPRFILQVTADRPWISGPDTTRKFVALSSFIINRYVTAASGNGYIIYEAREPS